MSSPQILGISPEKAVPGGDVIITCRNFNTSDFWKCKVLFGTVAGRIVGASENRVIASAPLISEAAQRTAGVRLIVGDQRSDLHPFIVAERLAENVHPVTNPVFDHDTGNIYVTFSGSMGQKVPVSVWKIAPNGTVSPFLTNIVNPTAIAFDSEGTMYISSRHDGTVYRISPFKETEPFAQNLGVATGMAFDSQGRLYVGDRQGTVFKIDESGRARPFARLEPSVSAYHMAFGSDGYLYVTGPTAATYDSIVRISPTGEVSKFFSGFGRPQGLAFDHVGNLYVAASYQGRRGIYRVTPYKDISLVVAGNSLVGLTFDDSGNMILASTREVYRVMYGVRGIL